MYVCVCHAVSDSDIQELLDRGVDKVQDIQRECGAGTSCGSCICDLSSMLNESKVKDTNR